ncbi:hypothetical protein [Nostoc sp. 'Peltigera malacea cyanobiont' DB3992]|uniref:hypothetical protein n=1 Tax=Nostoc sp. 'Peltigera malacea cyanobiont' DB3992 TaxID=1206980 RepID=UPI0026BFA95E|nr:hypothetical protein [Nostoc sp. 'Peltigera malacea cyanobiont' DB3992]
MRTSQRRLNKLRLYAAIKDTTMTHVIEDLIDSLKIPEIGNSSSLSYGTLREREAPPTTNIVD